MKCKKCGRRLTRATQKKQHVRLIGRAFTDLEAQAVMPRCQKCVALWLRGRTIAEGID